MKNLYVGGSSTAAATEPVVMRDDSLLGMTDLYTAVNDVCPNENGTTMGRADELIISDIDLTNPSNVNEHGERFFLSDEVEDGDVCNRNSQLNNSGDLCGGIILLFCWLMFYAPFFKNDIPII